MAMWHPTSRDVNHQNDVAPAGTASIAVALPDTTEPKSGAPGCHVVATSTSQSSKHFMPKLDVFATGINLKANHLPSCGSWSMSDDPITAHLAMLSAELERRTTTLVKRERDVAAAAEQLSQSAAVQAAWAGGQQAERQRITAMIDLQLEQLHHAGLNAISLKALRQHINDQTA
jgi:hypothetical protein